MCYKNITRKRITSFPKQALFKKKENCEVNFSNIEGNTVSRESTDRHIFRDN